MFESAELGHQISKARFHREAPKLRTALLNAELDLVERKAFPLIVVIGGVDGAGKGETVNLLNEWMDPRYVRTHAFGPPNEEERGRPAMWRFWRTLPPKGTIGIYFGSWYSDPIVDEVYGRSKDAAFERSAEDIVRFERMLVNEGAVLVKFWFHLSKKNQRQRLEGLEKDKSTRWRVTKDDWKNHRHYDAFRKTSEQMLRQTSREDSPWIVIEGTDARYRALTVGTVLVDTMRARLDAPQKKRTAVRKSPILPAIDDLHVLRTLDLRQRVSKNEYSDELLKLQGKLNRLSRDPKFSKIAVVTVFEGNDAAGKGSTIRRITGALDARTYRTVPIAAPTEDERAQPYLWRFWRQVPKDGTWAIFDRSWYGRVLVERVEGFAEPLDWMRAYQEINDFEEQLVRDHTVVVKFWLAVSKEEQFRRFRARQTTRFKRFKITPDDWRNRKKWEDYELAACDMIDRTSTEFAPWTLIEANNKHFARLKALRTLVDRIERAL